MSGEHPSTLILLWMKDINFGKQIKLHKLQISLYYYIKLFYSLSYLLQDFVNEVGKVLRACDRMEYSPMCAFLGRPKYLQVFVPCVCYF